MDNFMDRLSKRFNAAEIIQANGEAEARETERLRQQMTEYDAILQEVRRLNLKTAEMTEQVSQMIASGIEQFESYTQDDVSRQLLMEEAPLQTEGLEEIRDFLVMQQNDMQDELESRLDGISLRIDNNENSIRREVSDASGRIDASINQLGEEAALNRRALEAKLDELQRELTQAEDDGQNELPAQIADAVRQSIELQADSAAQTQEKIGELQRMLLMQQEQEQPEELRQFFALQADSAVQIQEKIGELQRMLLMQQEQMQEREQSEEIRQFFALQADSAAQIEEKIGELQRMLLMQQQQGQQEQEQQREQTEESRQFFTAQQDALRDDIGSRVDGISYKVESSADSMKREISDAAYRIDASISQLGEEASLNRRAVESQIGGLQQSILEALRQEEGQDETASQLEEQLKEGIQAQADSSKQIKEMIVNLRLYMDEVQKHIEDYVHKEDVKVYRNVQANIAEQMTNRFRDIGDRVDSLEKETAKNGKMTKLMLLATLLLAGVSAVIQIMQMLG